MEASFPKTKDMWLRCKEVSHTYGIDNEKLFFRLLNPIYGNMGLDRNIDILLEEEKEYDEEGQDDW